MQIDFVVVCCFIILSKVAGVNVVLARVVLVNFNCSWLASTFSLQSTLRLETEFINYLIMGVKAQTETK